MWFEVDQSSMQARPQQRYNDDFLSAMGVKAAAQPARSHIAIGFADYGFDLLHPTLIDHTHAASRFRHLWDQNTSVAPSDATTWDGRVTDAWVADAIASGSRRALDCDYDCHAACYGKGGAIGGAHGTLMASIAAGGRHAGFRSAAAGADLIGVHLALLDHDWKEQDRKGVPTWLVWDGAAEPVWHGWRSYGACRQIVDAVHYIYDRACRLGADGLVVNLSLGAWAGPHDGSTALERGIAGLIGEADARFVAGRGPRTVVVTGAGNAGADEGHWRGRLEGGSSCTFEWVMQRRDPSQNKLEIWFDAAPGDVAVTVGLPDGTRRAVTAERTAEFVICDRRVGIGAWTTCGARACVSLLIHPPFVHEAMPACGGDEVRFVIGLASRRAGAVEVNAWVERDDGALERSWLSPCHVEGALGCLATVPGALVVAGFDAAATGHADRLAPLILSGVGPAPWPDEAGRQVPHVVAPAAGIWGARSKSRGFTPTTGTSAAVALVAGALARHLAVNGADAPLPLPAGPWHPRFGFGPFRIDQPAYRGVQS